VQLLPKPTALEWRNATLRVLSTAWANRRGACDLKRTNNCEFRIRCSPFASCVAKPRGESASPLEKHAQWLLALIEKQPDLTLDEVVCAMHKHGIAGSRTAVWGFFKRHKISFKKKPARHGAGSPRRGAGTSKLEAAARHAEFDPAGVHR